MKKLSALLFVFFSPFFFYAEYVPYQGRYKAIDTKHFTVLFTDEFANEASKAANYAEDIYERLQKLMDWKPFHKILVILMDHTDSPNGLATPLFRNTIYLYMAPSDRSEELRDYADPFYSLILHELTHILQLDQIRGGAWFWRVLYWRSYFPLTGAFSWFHEGTAVYTESRYSEGGRLSSSYHKAIVERYAKKRAIPDYSRIVYPIVDFPYNNLAYHLGGRFVSYLIETYGEEKFSQFMMDMSNDFWPFVYEFVLKFKKVYRKDLKTLWNEWREFEYAQVGEFETAANPEYDAALQTYGKVLDFTAGKRGELYYTGYSAEKGRGVYRLNGEGGQKTKIMGESPDTIRYCRDGLLMIKNTALPGGFFYDDLYYFSFRTKIVRRLTFGKRITELDYRDEDNFGVYMKQGELYSFRLDNNKVKVAEEKKISVGTFAFIGNLHLSPDSKRLLFSCRTEEKNYQIACYDFSSGAVEVIEGVQGKAGGWLNSDEICFTGPSPEGASGSALYRYQMKQERKELLYYGDGAVLNGKAAGDRLYCVVYQMEGEEIQWKEIPPGQTEETDLFEVEPEHSYEAVQGMRRIEPVEQFPTFYQPFRYLAPNRLILPAFLNSQSNFWGISIPTPTVGLTYYNTLPLGRFRYALSVAFDYVNRYPVTSLELGGRVPCMDITYRFFTDCFEAQRFSFQNEFYFSPYFTVDNENYLFFHVGASSSIIYHSKVHFWEFWEKFTGSAGYSYRRQHPLCPVWNNGASFLVSGTASLERNLLYDAGVLASAEWRIPLGKHYLFLKNKAGISFFRQDNFFFGTNNLALNQSVISEPQSFATKIDLKGFSLFQGGYPKGGRFLYASAGAFFVLYRRTHYWKFLTTGFKGIYLRPFTEYAWIRSVKEGNRHLIDAGADFSLDLFVGYGNIGVTFVQGNAIGYEVGKLHPTYNGYFYVNFSVDL